MTLDARERLERLVSIERELARRRADNPLDHMAWLPGQHAFLLSDAKLKLLRAGRQTAGKTTAGAAETVWRMMGRHPFRQVRPPPVKGWVVCGGGEQSEIVQERIWSLVPKSEVAPGFAYDTRKGAFLGKYPRLRLKNGSEIWVKTGQQDSLNLASGTLDFVWVDEPPENQGVWSELLARILRLNGDIYLTLTPINRPVDWLHQISAKPGETTRERPVEDLHFALTPENLIPVGSDRPMTLIDGTVCDQDWIDFLTSRTVEYERPVVLDGSWEFRIGGAYFDGAWDPNKLVYDALPDKTDKIVVGIDHGDRPGKQVFTLMAVSVEDPPSVHVMDQYRDLIGTASPMDDAKGLLAMIARHRNPRTGRTLQYADLHFVGGDRVHLPGSGKQKSNRDLAAQIKKVLKVPDLTPPVRTIKRGEGRGAGSLSIGSRWLYHAMVAGRFSVAPHLTFLVDAIPKYTLKDDDLGVKDSIDSIRYGLDQWIFSWARSPSPIIRVR